ncbi:MAG: ATP-binding cassette domain-containing protein [Coriobacteriales bacterium]|nr:ATP-binding cassette domain-containing protein [Coriobacteriales bacterium]
MLSAHALSFAYPGTDVVVLRDLDLTVAPTERLALSAPSGKGKSTLCRLLAGYLTPTAGTVTLGGEPLPKRGVCSVQLIAQHPELVCNPRMRMATMLKEAGEASAGLLERLGIRDEWLSRFPHELSGGEMQRFCIARALAASPRYLIADEISTMLDAVTQAQIWQALLDEVQRRDIGLVFVSHSPALTLRIATRTVEL